MNGNLTKILLAPLGLLLVLPASMGASVVIFERDFEAFGTHMDRFRNTQGDYEFHYLWDIESARVKGDGFHYARLVATVERLPAEPTVRWYGGLMMQVQEDYRLPEEWTVAFDYRTETLDPFRVRVLLWNGFEPRPPWIPDSEDWEDPIRVVYTAWVHPASTEWNRAVLDNGLFTKMETKRSIYRGTSLKIGLASHDPDGNPLALSSVGNHEMHLDNITFSVIPEPRYYGALIGAGIFMLLFARRFAGRRLASEREGSRELPV